MLISPAFSSINTYKPASPQVRFGNAEETQSTGENEPLKSKPADPGTEDILLDDTQEEPQGFIAKAVYWVIETAVKIIFAPVFLALKAFEAIAKQLVDKLPGLIPKNDFTEKLEKLKETSANFAKQVKQLQDNKTLPTYNDENLLEKVGRFINGMNFVTTQFVHRMVNMPQQLQNNKLLTELNSGTPDEQANAAQNLLHEFMMGGLPHAYPDYFRPVVSEQEGNVSQKATDLIENLQRYVVFDKTSEGYEYKGISASTPQRILKNMIETSQRFDTNDESLSEMLESHIPNAKDMALPMVALAAFDAQMQLGHARAFKESTSLDQDKLAELGTAFEQIHSEQKEDWLEGITYFAKMVGEDPMSYAQRLGGGHF